MQDAGLMRRTAPVVPEVYQELIVVPHVVLIIQRKLRYRLRGANLLVVPFFLLYSCVENRIRDWNIVT